MSGNKKRNIAILESTGSIGTQALSIIDANPDRFQVEVLTAHSNADLLAEQALKFQANAVVIQDESKYKELKDRLFDHGIKVFCGSEALVDIVEMESVDLVLNALVGFSGLRPTIRAIQAGKNIALANKETLVVAGDLITKSARQKGVNIYPVGLAHSAIFQCLAGDFHNKTEKIYLTASGGPFRGRSKEELLSIHTYESLKHIDGDAKITIDSASMMTKGLEVIEAKWLFGLNHEQIDVIIHPQSIIHSIVQFEDGSMKAQMGLSDMKLPIQFAMSYPERLKSDFPRFDFMEYPQLTFEKPDYKIFRNLGLAISALQKGGNAPCVLNAANEIAVQAFLDEKIGFLKMSDIIEKCLENISHISLPSFDDYFETDRETRIYAESILPQLTKGHYTK